jgi:hypothetical protein
MAPSLLHPMARPMVHHRMAAHWSAQVRSFFGHLLD